MSSPPLDAALGPDLVTVGFHPAGGVVRVPAGTAVSQAAAAAGVELVTPCGGQGRCKRCRVVVRGPGLTPPDDVERDALGEDALARGVRLACRARLSGNAEVEVPASSTTAAAQILERSVRREVPVAPNVRRVPLQIATPSLEDQRSDLARLLAALPAHERPSHIAVQAMAALPSALRTSDYRVRAVLVGDHLTAVEPDGREAGRCCGVAVDIGTTTVVVYLLDLETGEQLAAASAHNTQAVHGADVVSRVDYAGSTPRGLQELREVVLGVVNRLLEEACVEAGVEAQQVHECTVVGNTCMMHLFLGLSPKYIAQTPYIPVSVSSYEALACEVGVGISPAGSVYCLPCIAGWVGADTTGVLTAVALDSDPRPRLALDIGTNGEVMLWTGTELLVCSTAAGPAFEGAQIEHGMRAARGAIERIALLDGDLEVATIGEAPAVGICGSGLLDAIAVLLDAAVLDPSGRLVPPDQEGAVAGGMRTRLNGEGNQRHVVLVPAEDAGREDGPVWVSQRDVRQVQLAKGAIRAGVETLLAEGGLQAEDLEEIILAGAFGSYISKRSAVRAGLIPQLPLERIRSVGNAAGAGAVLALLSLHERAEATRLAARARHVELASRPDFQMRFMETMLFPGE